jgi:hypothetical protein
LPPSAAAHYSLRRDPNLNNVFQLAQLPLYPLQLGPKPLDFGLFLFAHPSSPINRLFSASVNFGNGAQASAQSAQTPTIHTPPGFNNNTLTPSGGASSSGKRQTASPAT